MSIFLAGPQCGPVLGPVLGGALTEANWRWIFGFLAISGFVLWVIIFMALPETLRARVGNGSIYKYRGPLIWPPSFSSPLAPSWERGPPPPVPTIKGYWNMFCYPPIGIVTFNTAMLYSTYFAIAVQLPTELSVRYRWSPAAIGAGFLAVGIAMIVGSLSGGRFSDWRRARAAKAAPDGKVDPEFRLVDQIWGVLVCVAGCIMYGWLVHVSAHPAPVLLATFLSKYYCFATLETGSWWQKRIPNDAYSFSRLRHELGFCRHYRVSYRVCGTTSGRRLCPGQYAPQPWCRNRGRDRANLGQQNGQRVVLHRPRITRSCPSGVCRH